MKSIKKILLLLTALVLCFAAFGVVASADTQTPDLSGVLEYDGLAARIKNDKSGIRSLYSINMTKVAALENQGYDVFIGAVMGIGTVKRDQGTETVNTTRDLAVSLTGNEIVSTTPASKAITVYATLDNALGIVGTERYTRLSSTTRSFAYTTVYGGENETRAYYEDIELVYTGFVMITDKNGNTVPGTETAYARAEGPVFGSALATYGETTSVYEVAEYFLNHYRESQDAVESRYSISQNLRRIVSAVGVSTPAESIHYGTATKTEATDTNETTYVMDANTDKLSFTVDNMSAGVYKLLMKAEYGGNSTTMYTYVNNRQYTGQTKAATSSVSSGLVAKDALFTDVGIYLTLEAGKNDIVFYTGATSAKLFGVSAFKLQMVDELPAGTVYINAYEDLDPTVVQGFADNGKYNTRNPFTYPGETSSYGGVDSANLGTAPAYFTYKVNVPFDGEYRMAGMIKVVASDTLTVNLSKNGTAVAGNGGVKATGLWGIDSGNNICYSNTAFGTYSLEAGEYQITVKTSGRRLILADMFLIPVPPKEEASKDDLASEFTVTADKMTPSSDSITQAATDTTALSYKFTANEQYVSFTVPNAKAGIYEMTYKGKSLNRAHDIMLYNVTTGRKYNNIISQSAGSLHSDTPLPLTMDYLDDNLTLVLANGKNELRIVANQKNSTATNPVYFGDIELKLVEEIFPETVPVYLESGYPTKVPEATCSGYLGGSMFRTSNGTTVAVLPLTISESGTYKMSALIASANATITASFKQGESVVKTLSYSDPSSWQGGSGRGQMYSDGFGTVELAQGSYTLEISASTNWFSLSDIYFTNIEATLGDLTDSFTVTADKMTPSASSMTQAATDTTALSYKFTASSQSLSFTVPNAKAGIYKLTYKGQSIADYHDFVISNTTTGRKYDAVMVKHFADDTPLAIDAAYRDNGFTLVLTNGKNEIKLSPNSQKTPTSSAPFYIGDIELTLIEEIFSETVPVFLESAYTGKVWNNIAGYKGSSGFSGTRTESQTSVAGLSVTIPEDGIYKMSALIASDKAKMTATFKQGDTVVKTLSYTDTAGWQGGSWRGTMYSDKFGTVELAQGSYTLEITASTNWFTLSDIYFTPVELFIPKKEYVTNEYEFEWLSGKVTAEGILSETNYYYTNLIHVPKSGTAFYVSIPGAGSGFADSATLAVSAYNNMGGIYLLDTASPYNVTANGYKDTAGIEAASGRLIYTVTTTEDDVYLRFSGKTPDESSIRVLVTEEKPAEGEEGGVSEFIPVPPPVTSSSLSGEFTSLTLGERVTANVTVTAEKNGSLICLAYDAGESLIGSQIVEKSEEVQALSFGFAPVVAREVKSIRLLLIDAAFAPMTDMLVYNGNSLTSVPYGEYELTKDEMTTYVDIPYAISVTEGVPSGGVITLSDGTYLLKPGAANSVTYTVYAEEAGIYALNLKMNRCGGYVQYFHVWNDSYPEWKGEGQGRFGTSSDTSTAATDEDYAVGARTVYGAYGNTVDASVYLKKGENKIRVYITSGNTNLGLAGIRFMPVKLYSAIDTTLLYPLTGSGIAVPEDGNKGTLGTNSSFTNNGYFLRTGSTAFFEITVPENGAYLLSALLSSSAPTMRFSSPTESFATQTASLGTLSCGEVSTSVLYRELLTLHLAAGTHKIQMDVTAGYIHLNMLMLKRVGNYDVKKAMSVDLSKTLDRDSHKLTVNVGISGYDYYSVDENRKKMQVILEGSYTKNDGSLLPISEQITRDSFVSENEFVFDLVANAAKSVELTVYIKDSTGERTLYTSKKISYDMNKEPLKVYFVTDWHYCGSNETQEFYSYKTNSYVTRYNYSVNWNASQCDIYGFTSDSKMQNNIDQLVQKYQNGEFDILFVLGDATMNDGTYDAFDPRNVRYEKSGQYGQSIEEFYEHPLNNSYMLQKLYLSQLADAGIPFFMANGNHDYMFAPNDDYTDLQFEGWEGQFHYAELFGHKVDGKYVDTTTADYLVRVIRRNGEIKILSALSSAELEAFKVKYADDDNCYDFYVSEDTLTDSDELVSAFMMTNPFQFESFKYYFEVGIVNGDYSGQTIRYDYTRSDILDAMCDRAEEYPSTYIVSHHVTGSDKAIVKAINENPNIAGIFFGDIHNEEHGMINGIPYWCVGHTVTDFDYDYYYVRDPETGEYALDANGNRIPDNQYYSDRSNPQIGNAIWSDYNRHPFSQMILTVYDETSYAERSHKPYYYESGYQALTLEWLRGRDPNYLRASEPTWEHSTTHTVGNRVVYVGTSTHLRGTSFAYLGTSYVKNSYNDRQYVIEKPASGTTYKVYDLNGAPVMNGDAQVTVELSSYDEGTSCTLFGETYYIITKIGGIFGSYLYDENGDFVYATKNGGYAFYDFYYDANGNIVREYFYLNENDEFVSLGEWNADHTVYTLKDGIYTDIRLWKESDGSFGKRSRYYVDKATIEIKNGIFVRGEGFTNFNYAHCFVDEYGNPVNESDVLLVDDKLGLYIPREYYLGEWMTSKANLGTQNKYNPSLLYMGIEGEYDFTFNPDVLDYTVTLPAGRPQIPLITVEGHEGTEVSVVQATLPDGESTGVATVTVTKLDKETVYTVTFVKSAEAGFVLQYDDRYSFTPDYTLGDSESFTFESTDAALASVGADGVITAKAVTNTPVTITAKVNGDVKDTLIITRIEKAVINLFLVTGQSNANGCYDLGQTAMNDKLTAEEQLAAVLRPNAMGQVYSYNATMNKYSAVSGAITFSYNTLFDMNQHAVNGFASALGTTYYNETGEKVVFLQTARDGTAIEAWVPSRMGGGTWASYANKNLYDETVKAYEALLLQLDPEKYEIRRTHNYWLQGETNMLNGYSFETGNWGGTPITNDEYYGYFVKLASAMQKDMNVSFQGIILARTRDNSVKVNDVRSAQYALGNLEGIGIVSRLCDLVTMTNAGNAYKGLPEVDEALYGYGMMGVDNVHYNQSGHNENGIRAALSTVKQLFTDETAASLIVMDKNGEATLVDGSTVTVNTGASYRITGYALLDGIDGIGDSITYTVEDTDIATVDIFGDIVGVTAGETALTVRSESGLTVTLTVKVP